MHHSIMRHHRHCRTLLPNPSQSGGRLSSPGGFSAGRDGLLCQDRHGHHRGRRRGHHRNRRRRRRRHRHRRRRRRPLVRRQAVWKRQRRSRGWPSRRCARGCLCPWYSCLPSSLQRALFSHWSSIAASDGARSSRTRSASFRRAGAAAAASTSTPGTGSMSWRAASTLCGCSSTGRCSDRDRVRQPESSPRQRQRAVAAAVAAAAAAAAVAAAATRLVRARTLIAPAEMPPAVVPAGRRLRNPLRRCIWKSCSAPSH